MLWFPAGDPREGGHFNPGSLDLTEKFQSVLPGADILRDTVLDPGLGIANWRSSPVLHALTVNSFTVDTLRLQQFMAGWSANTLGVLSEYGPYFQGALDAFDVPMTTSMHDLIESIILSTIGGVGSVLSAIPNPYTQIAGALLGIGTQLYQLLAEGPTELPPFTIPAQEYNEQTDQDQFNTKVRALLRLGSEFQSGASQGDAELAFDYTSLFMPRLIGDPVLEYRFQGSRLGVAFGFGDHGGVNRILERDCRHRKGGPECDSDISPGESFTASGPTDLGYVPGGVRITSIIQCFPTENAVQNTAPWYDPRCGSNISKADGTDVGMFYTSTNQGIQLLWDWCMKNSPQMFAIDTERLKSAWADTIDAALDGIKWLWNRPEKDDWGQGTWHAMIGTIASAYTVGVHGGQTVPGAIGTVTPNMSNCGSLNVDNDPLFFDGWKKYNLYDALIKPALDSLSDRQTHFLEESLIAAYLPRPVHNYVAGAINQRRPDMLQTFQEARSAILEGPAKVIVVLEDIIDPGYRAQIEAALPKFKTFDITAAPPGPGRPSGRLVAPPFPPSGDPPFTPPTEPPVGPSTPRGMTRLQKGLAIAAVGGTAATAAYLARHQLADLYRWSRRG